MNAVTGGPTTLGGGTPGVLTNKPNSGLSGNDLQLFLTAGKTEYDDHELQDFCIQHFYANDPTSYLYTAALTSKIVVKVETNGIFNSQSIVGKILIPNLFTFDTGNNGKNEDSTGDTHPADPDEGIDAGKWHGISACTQFYFGNQFDYYPQSKGLNAITN